MGSEWREHEELQRGSIALCQTLFYINKFNPHKSHPLPPAMDQVLLLYYFTNEEIEVQRGKVPWPRSHNKLVAEFVFERFF